VATLSREDEMFARLSTYQIPPERKEEAQANFEGAVGQIREAEGLEKAVFMVGCDSDRAVTITFWESHAAMSASRVMASRLRSDAASSVEGDVVSVDEFEVISDE
jgi:heme-degrading monooxygenase HmoA